MQRKTQRGSSSPAAASLFVADLVDGFRRGDPVVSEELVRRFGVLLLRHSQRRLAQHRGVASTTAEDVLQGVWVALSRILQKPRDFRDEATLEAYLCRIADRLVNRRVRASHAAKRSTHREEAFDVTRHDRAGSAQDPAVFAAFADEWRYLLETVACQDATLLLALHQGDSLPAAAALAGVNSRTARRRLVRLKGVIESKMCALGK